jgi:hypothetical protein
LACQHFFEDFSNCDPIKISGNFVPASSIKKLVRIFCGFEENISEFVRNIFGSEIFFLDCTTIPCSENIMMNKVKKVSSWIWWVGGWE